MSKRHKMDFQALIQNELAPAVATVAESSSEQRPAPLALVQPLPKAAPATVGKGRGTLKQRTRQQSLYLEIPVYETLREIAHTERTSMHALYLEGVDAVLKTRGSPPIKELVGKKPKPVL